MRREHRHFNCDFMDIQSHREIMAKKLKDLALKCANEKLAGIEILFHLKMSNVLSLYDETREVKESLKWFMFSIWLPSPFPVDLSSAIFLHDIHLKMETNRTERRLEEINGALLENSVKLIKKKFGWWSPMRYKLIKLIGASVARFQEEWSSNWLH